MNQTILFSNVVPDYFTARPIEKEDSIQFFTGWNESGFVLGHTQQAEQFEKIPKVGVYSPHVFGQLIDLEIIQEMVRSGYYSYGIYNKKCLFHVQKITLDIPTTYKKFENTQKIVCSGLNDKTTLKREFNQNVAMGVISPTNRILEGHDYTFGVEIETSHGRIDRFKDLNASCVIIMLGSPIYTVIG